MYALGNRIIKIGGILNYLLFLSHFSLCLCGENVFNPGFPYHPATKLTVLVLHGFHSPILPDQLIDNVCNKKAYVLRNLPNVGSFYR